MIIQIHIYPNTNTQTKKYKYGATKIQKHKCTTRCAMHQHANKKSSTFLRDIPVSSRPPSKNLFTQIIWANAHQAGKLHQSESLCTGDRPNPWVVIHLLARDLAVLDQRWVTRALRKSYFLEVTQLRETGLGNLTINWQLKKNGKTCWNSPFSLRWYKNVQRKASNEK